MTATDIRSSFDFHRTEVSIDTELAKIGGEAAILEAKLAQIRKREDHLGQVFAARGGWTRAFLVNNTNGHVHSSTHCQSCFATTQFQWRTELSGSDQNEIIAAAGELACTVCYPDAPVAVTSKPGTLRTDAMIEREARAAKAAKAAEVKNAKAITTPAGDRLMGRHGYVATERAAEIEAVGFLVDIISAKVSGNALHMVPEYVETSTRLMEALAAKRGADFYTVLAGLAAKAAKKEQAEAREYNRTSMSVQYGKATIHSDGVDIIHRYF